MKKGKILVVDDNAGIRSALKLLLPLHFADVRLLPSPSGLISVIGEFRPDAVLLDMNFDRDINTGNEGLFWLSEIRRHYPDVPVVLFTAYADISLAVEGMKRGAADFIVKPWDNDRLVSILSEACAGHKSKGKYPEEAVRPAMRWGTGPEMTALRRLVDRIAPTDATVLITGENGTGKDLMAQEIHALSSRRSGPMVCVDLGAVTETLFESELFGHVKGAFTDARSDHMGKIQQAEGGTLFLDEIGNIPLHLQAKLLRVLQNRCVTPVGGTSQIPVDIRLVCATNMDLEAMVRNGTFREDLYYRINTMQIHLPPLRERRDEIIPLAEDFISQFSEKYSRTALRGLSPEAERLLVGAYWKGNIRELRNCIEKAVIISDSPMIRQSDLDIQQHDNVPDPSYEQGQTLDMVEEKAIRAAMRKFGGNLSMVAKSLDISRPTLYSKLKKYNI